MVGVTEKLSFSFDLAGIHLTLKAARMDRVVWSNKKKKNRFLGGSLKERRSRVSEKSLRGDGEMAWWLKILLSRYEDQSYDPKIPQKCLVDTVTHL